MKVLIPILLLLIILCACNDSVVPSANDSISSENSAESSLPQSVSQSETIEAASSSTSDSIDEKRQTQKELIAELTEKSVISIKHGKDDYLFLYFVDGELNCRMIRPRYVSGIQVEYKDFDETIKVAISPYDGIFYRAMEQDGRAVELSYDFQSGHVTLTVEKNNYYLNFENGTYTHEVKYRLKDLSPHYLINTSPDNKLELYATYIDGAGESQWGDYVILNTETQDIWYIAAYDLYDDTIFYGSDEILIISQYYDKITNSTAIQLLNAHTGKSMPNAPQFDFGTSEQFENTSKYFIVGIAYDSVQKKTLIAYRETGDGNICYDPIFKIYIAIFNENGKQINTIDTSFMMQPSIIVFPNHVTFESAENGVAIVSTSVSADDSIKIIELGSITY